MRVYVLVTASVYSSRKRYYAGGGILGSCGRIFGPSHETNKNAREEVNISGSLTRQTTPFPPLVINFS